MMPRVIGGDAKVPLANGGYTTYANLDYAATAPCLESVRAAIDDALAQYSSVHRGSGYLSQVTSELYERVRGVVRDFVGAGPEHSVIFTRNTTDSMNLMAHVLAPGTNVVVFESEHHATLLPWERKGVSVTRL